MDQNLRAMLPTLYEIHATEAIWRAEEGPTQY